MKRHNIPTYKLVETIDPIQISFLTPTVFSALVELKSQSGGVPLLEAVQLVCDEKRIECESVKALLTKSLKQKITQEATAAHLLKKF